MFLRHGIFILCFYAFPNPNIDRFYLEKNKNKYSGCWKLADIPNIKYSNKHWQVMELPRATLFLYAAYLDTREDFIQINSIQKYFFTVFFYNRTVLPVIRIMAFVRGGKIKEDIWKIFA